ncbi:MAG: NYN domain-containing protein [Anaerolineaceae bacterium]|nr:NYN domain-containing protein [Anaerolineaceae bacterium]
MQYLIDGHNLIPKMPGLSLSDPEDEENLIQALSSWAKTGRHKMVVFFDRAPLGRSGTRKAHAISAVFVPAGKTADSAIMDALSRLKGNAKNVTVVSSDRMIQAAARAVHAAILRSEDFSKMVAESRTAQVSAQEPAALTSDEIKEWELLFSENKGKIQ